MQTKLAGKRKAAASPRRRDPVAPIPVEAEGGEQAETSPFPIVGVGASAGGLEAFSQMLGALPVDTGMAFVLVQHLSPTHASLLADILSRTTAMPVTEVKDEPRVQPNHVYVIPPDRNMIISHGVLQLLPRNEARGHYRPIDFFLRSLAEDQGYRAIGVILSGTATDGTLGLEAIKAEGGITFAQDKTAQQSSMPQSAIARGCVDFELPPDEIAKEIGHIARHPHVAPAGRKSPADEPDLGPILEVLNSAKGVDFSLYKANTLYRRITRRMVLHKLQGLQAYARLLRQNPAEVEALYQDTLINVTRFFRNPETFEALKAKVLPKLIQNRSGQEPLRVWVPGCSTGEEAYSIAILIAEIAAARGSQIAVQIFGTDLNEECVDKARAGVYPPGITADVAPERLEQFFAAVNGGYRISKPIRDMCVFARHNLLTDPPFSQIDLVSCRNLLIYLGPALQQRIVPILHYALKPSGFLVLGSSETIGSFRALFEAEDARHRIYSKRPGTHRATAGSATGLYRGRRAGDAAGKPAGTGADVQTEADRILLARYAPPGVLVNADLEILQFRGDTGPYLAPAPGKASLNLLRMAREGLLVTLRAAIRRATKEEAAVREEGLRVKSGGTIRQVNLEVVPVKGSSARDSGFLILFEEPLGSPLALPPGKKRRAPPPPADLTAAGGEAAEQENVRLTQELAATRDYLQLVIEQQESAYEELQSASEEAQSANEELQSINEELETSKEEIQSSNEELITVNDELQHSNLELNQLNNDLVNLLGGVDMAIVMLGPDLRVRRFTPAAQNTFNLAPGDIGRPIGELKLNLSIADLGPLLSEVIETEKVQEREVQDGQGCWYSLRIRPYRTLENKIEGAVILLVDVDRLRRARKYAEGIIATLGELLLVLDGDLRVQTASRSFYETFQVTPEQTEGRFLYDLAGGPWDLPELRALLSEVLRHDEDFEDFEVEAAFEPIGPRTLLLTARKLDPESGHALILLAIQDVTERRQLEVALRQRVQELAAADRSKNEFLALLAHELRNPLAPLRNAVQVLEAPGADGAAVERARKMIGRQVHNMSRLIEDLLDVSRINQGKVLLRRERVELADVLRQAVELIHSQSVARGQEVSLSLPDERIELDADPTRLEQVFGNLLSNASKFTPRGGHVWVTAELAPREPQSAGEVCVRVRDDGIGIAPEALAHVFDLFMQADRSLDRTRGGLGIGLTLVHRLVTLHGGSVEARSAGLGQGSEIVVRLPVLPPADAEPGRGAGAADGAAPDLEHSFVAPYPLRVLVVDDNVDTAESLALLLRLRGHEVEVAHDGLAALELAATFEPEVVLLDIGLPGLDGYQVAGELRRRTPAAGALLVALTGYGQEEDQRRAREAGFDHHLTKPVDPQVIYQLLAQARPRLSASSNPALRPSPGDET